MKKLEARARAAQILAAALDVAERHGYTRLTREQVAARIGIAPSLVPHYMGTMAAFRRRIMREAVRVECLAVVAQGLAVRDPHAMAAPADLRQRAVASLLTWHAE
jgi:AcrR family transcriptional regulator